MSSKLSLFKKDVSTKLLQNNSRHTTVSMDAHRGTYTPADRNPYDLETGGGNRFGPQAQYLARTRHNQPTGIALPQQAYTSELQVWQPSLHQQSSLSSTSTLEVQSKSHTEFGKVGTHNVESNNIEPPPKYHYAWLNILRWEWLSVYRRLNLTVLLINIIIIIVFAANGKLLQLDPGAMSTALVANVTTAVIFRQEYVVNTLFLIFGCCPPSWPLWIRRLAAKVYHFGGVHSGAGIASVMWLGLLDTSLVLQFRTTDLTTRDFVAIIITSVLNLLLVCVVVTSHPKFREKYHNIWELIHRFGGWISAGLFWVNFGILTNKERDLVQPDESIFRILLTNPTFWMLFVVTMCLIMPWLRLRKVPVQAEWQSKYAIRLHFDYTNLPLCAAPRFSKSPLMEWHSFAGIPHENGIGFSVLISGVGDWTRDMVNNPPQELWTRGIPVRGVLHLAPIFRRVVLVATGSGIGPVLSLLYAREISCRILWCTREPSEAYKPEVLNQVLKADPEAEIISRKSGERDPELGSKAYRLHQQSQAEAVFIISNKEGCYKARIWLESRGVVVFTPIFDS